MKCPKERGTKPDKISGNKYCSYGNGTRVCKQNRLEKRLYSTGIGNTIFRMEIEIVDENQNKA